MYDDVALDKDLAVLGEQGAKVFTIGYTVLGRPIKCVVKGNLNGPCVLVQASMHAREYITTPLVIEWQCWSLVCANGKCRWCTFMSVWTKKCNRPVFKEIFA